MISDLEIIDACGRICEALTPEKLSNNWTIFTETQDLNGQMGYTYQGGEYGCDTAEEALRKAVTHLPRFLDPEETRIRCMYVIRREHVHTFDLPVHPTPQFQPNEGLNEQHY